MPAPAAELKTLIAAAIDAAGGWLPFECFMALALYSPGLGYYARDDAQFGRMPASGSDFVTAPELSPLFGRALARPLAQVLDATLTHEVVEFGAGSGALAAQLLDALGERVRRYTIVDVSAALLARQRTTLARFGERVRWVAELPDAIDGVVVGNEVLDAMPAQLVAFDGVRWLERGVVVDGDGFAWHDRPAELALPAEATAMPPGSVTELHRHAVAFIATLAERLRRGAAFFIDYGFPAAEYYHPQRSGGTLMCHRGHRADTDPLADVGAKDITAHVNWSAVALAAQRAGCEVLGYASQAGFLIDCGLLDELARDGGSARASADVQTLLNEHEMGELFKVLAFGRGLPAFEPIGLRRGDRTHRL